MRILRPFSILLGLLLLAAVLAWLGSQPAADELPTGSSLSSERDGARALYLWAEELGRDVARLHEPRLPSGDPPDTLMVIQPVLPVGLAARELFDEVPRQGGTLIVAGDSPATLAYLSALGLRVEPTTIQTRAIVPDSPISFDTLARARLRADDGVPLLLAPGGDVLAVRTRHQDGWLVALVTPGPLTNAALRQPGAARFVLEQVLGGPSASGLVAFDEAHYPASGGPEGLASDAPGLSQLVLRADGGRALVYAALVTFAFLWLAGRRLGPPVPATEASVAGRSMYEHVQALAGLYRRTRQLEDARQGFGHWYRRALTRAAGQVPGTLGNGQPTASPAERLASAVQQIERATSERELIVAVTRAEQALEELPRPAGTGGTLPTP